jgi:hypothetical protein
MSTEKCGDAAAATSPHLTRLTGAGYILRIQPYNIVLKYVKIR